MRVLVISEQPPDPQGATLGSQLVYQRLRLLADQYEITCAFVDQGSAPKVNETSSVFPFHFIAILRPPKGTKRPPLPRSRLKNLAQAWRHTLLDLQPNFLNAARDHKFEAALNELVAEQRPDVIHVVGTRMLYALPPVTQPVIAELVDTWSRSHWQRADEFDKPTYQLQYWTEGKKVERAERLQLERASVAIVVSKLEAAMVNRLAPRVPVRIIPPAFDLSRHVSPQFEAEPQSLLFVGTLDYPPNSEAVLYFAKEVLPHIKARLPQARFHVVGREPTPEIRLLAGPDIVVTGAVLDVRPFYARAAVVVVPILHGGGVRNKIIEAWGMEKAVVSTRLGAEGLMAKDGEHFLVRDDPNSFADAVIQLIKNPKLRAQIAAKGHESALENYSLEHAASRMAQVYDVVGRTQ